MKKERAILRFVNWQTGLLILGLFVVYRLGFSLLDLFKASQRIDKAKESLVVEQREREQLLAQIEIASSEAYIEEMARNELNMKKEGEVVVILEKEGKEGDSIETGGDGKPEEENWEKWWGLIR